MAGCEGIHGSMASAEEPTHLLSDYPYNQPSLTLTISSLSFSAPVIFTSLLFLSQQSLPPLKADTLSSLLLIFILEMSHAHGKLKFENWLACNNMLHKIEMNPDGK